MDSLTLALKYMDLFYRQGDVRALRGILHDDLKFQGPFHQYDGADAYINDLVENPPNGMDFSMRHQFVDGNTVCLVYDFRKPGVSTTMAQIFQMHEDKIKTIRLIFDRGAFTL